jgi:hypothetical protein
LLVPLTAQAYIRRGGAAYRHLGYRVYCHLIERLGTRRHGGWGLMRPIREAIRLTWPRDTR